MPRNVSTVSGKSYQVQKEAEYDQLLEYVAAGAWKNNTWLASVLGVDDDTVADWKKTIPVVKARQLAVKGLLKDFTRRGDVKDRLKENGMDFDAEKLDVSMKIEVLGLDSLE